MRLSRLVLSSMLLALAAPAVEAQFQVIGGGCLPAGGTPGAPFAVGQPNVGNIAFQVAHRPPAFGTVACFWLIGFCNSTPYPDFPASLNCGNPCGNVVDFSVPPILGGTGVPPNPVVTQFPIPNAPGLAGITVCIQYLCFGPVICSEISQGASITILP